MRVVLVCLLLVFGWESSWASGGGLTEIKLFGSTYVALKDWARRYDFRWKDRKASQDLKLSNRWSDLDFTIDSRKAAINGIEVWLSDAIARHRGRLYISRLDLETLVDPILFPPRNRKRDRVTEVALDPGHGGRDPGNQQGGHQEKRYTLLLAKEVRRDLLQAGLKVVMTRSTDHYVDLVERTELAKKLGADLFISLHYNSTPSDTDEVRGVEIYTLTPVGAESTNSGHHWSSDKGYPGNHYEEKSTLLGYELLRGIVKDVGMEDRGLRRARWISVLRTSKMPTALIEGGFMSNPSEARNIYSSSYRKKMAHAIVDGILAYKRLVER